MLTTLARNTFSTSDSFAAGLMMSVLCADEIPFDTPEAMAAGATGVNPRLVEYFAAVARSYLGACRFWKARAAPPLETAPVVSDIPTLLLAGDIDPATPLEWAHRTASALSRAQVAEFPWLDHGVFLAHFHYRQMRKPTRRQVPRPARGRAGHGVPGRLPHQAAQFRHRMTA